MRRVFPVAYQRRCVGMVDKMDLESIVERRASSSLATDTKNTAEKDTFSAVFFIQTAGLVYHRPFWAGYHRRRRISSRQGVYLLRFDDIQHSVLMIYRNKLRMIYKAHTLILVRFCAIIYLKR